MFATVRNRRAVLSAVEPFDSERGRIHLVHVEYKDDQQPGSERLLWEIEPHKTLLEPTALPNAASDPMPVEDFDALLRAARWTATAAYLDPDGSGPVDRLPISSPFHGAVQVEDYQLVPLLKALQMPRVNLLIADDVGLGKTVEAGLILSELLLRRRIQRVLILTPASLRLQWRDEMWDKFSLRFDLVDRAETHALRRRLGLDANPWRAFSRTIASYHYLRQEDVLEQFLAACRTPEGSPHLPWDLLIVDECHNLMPSAFGDDSDLCRMLRLIAPQFEHRLFLSATPHNGHTRCFTGLLEILDPVRFSQTSELKPAERGRVQQIVIRRLKREINARTNPPRFCTRLPPHGIALDLSAGERSLSDAFDAFRGKVRSVVGSGESRRRRSGSFAVEILGKRLLSCPTAFAESWLRSKAGLAAAEAVSDADVAAVERALRQETDDDREVQQREGTAAGVIGAWMHSLAEEVADEIAALDDAVERLGFRADADSIVNQDPANDARFSALLELVDRLLHDAGTWRDDERLVVFTEYKTTLDYLVRRLRERYEPERMLMLFGGMDETERDEVKRAFNDRANPVRLLLATDAAAEGLNLQSSARYLLHYDCPWNPSRLEQRNGRLDRHGQARDVTIFHFVSDQDHDLRFLAHVIRKADEIREDLGSANELFDEAAQRRFIHGEDAAIVQRELDHRVNAARGRAAFDADKEIVVAQDGGGTAQDIANIAGELDLDPHAMRDTLEAAMAIRAGRPQLECSEQRRTCKVIRPDLPGWSEVIDESLRKPVRGQTLGPVAQVAFSADPFMEDIGGRFVFSPRPDVLMMHLSHPMLQKALSTLTRRRFPGSGDTVSRWAVRRGEVPSGVDALLLLSIEELAINELREGFHHWVRTLAFPVRSGDLQAPLAHRPARDWRIHSGLNRDDHNHARELLLDVEPALRDFLATHAAALTANLSEQLTLDGKRAREQEEERYRSRQGEVSTLIEESTLAKLEREIEALRIERTQGQLFAEAERFEQIARSIEEKQEEIARRRRHYEEVRGQLERERERILKRVLPARHAMAGSAQVFPVSIEVRLPGGAS
jgi:superfamily II DNA or RNA helicase